MFFKVLFSKYFIKKINDNIVNINNKESFLAGIQTATDVNIGCTDNNKITNFEMFLFAFICMKKI